MRKLFYFVIFLIFSPIFLIYLISCLFLPLFKIGKIDKLKGRKKIFVIKDAIHSDYVFESKDWINVFKTKKKYVSIGWGDRSIFLETQKWADLKMENFVKAFFGLNKTVLRVDFFDEIPKEKRLKKFTVNKKQFNTLKKHISNSYNKQKIKKEDWHYQIGDFYESNLTYNCITNCNNWINNGLRKCGLSNRIWCPLSFWI
jgi:uncharacterized protein (TIGR02117 family)